jgi:hypothetical protein
MLAIRGEADSFVSFVGSFPYSGRGASRDVSQKGRPASSSNRDLRNEIIFPGMGEHLRARPRAQT